jgi:hypothetical protein
MIYGIWQIPCLTCVRILTSDIALLNDNPQGPGFQYIMFCVLQAYSYGAASEAKTRHDFTDLCRIWTLEQIADSEYAEKSIL